MDLYAYDETVKDWRHIGPLSPTGTITFYSLLKNASSGGGTPSQFTKKNTTYLLYLPVRNSIVDDSAAVGVPAGSYIAGTPPEDPMLGSTAPRVVAAGDVAPILRGGKDAIIWYGTSIQQGGVASRAGNLYDATIGRRLSRHVTNYGFAGNGHEDIGVAKYLTQLAASVIVLDCLPNMNAATVAAKTVPIVRYFRANGHAKTPIVLVENTHGAVTQMWFSKSELSSTQVMDSALHASYVNLTKAGDAHLSYVRGDSLFNGEEGEGKFTDPTVGGTHPSDLGQYDMADYYSKFLPTLIGAQKSDDDFAAGEFKVRRQHHPLKRERQVRQEGQVCWRAN